MDLSEFLDLAYRSVAEIPRLVWIQLGLILWVLGSVYLVTRLGHRRTHARLGLRTRGHCARCRYDPAAGTKTCPECGGSVLDMRLFRPLGRPADPCDPAGAEPAAPPVTASRPPEPAGRCDAGA